MQSKHKRIVILGTGGTIAGAASGSAAAGYKAGVIGIEALVAAVAPSGPAGLAVATEQIAQVDSKDMSFGLWQALAGRVAHHLADDEVAGIVITHGTDTLEETAYFLQRLLAPAKPVVLTAAMRPATAPSADGPQNLLDALTLAGTHGARGVLMVIGGQVFAGSEVRKRHTWRLDAFDAGDHGAVAHVREGSVFQQRDWPGGTAIGIEVLPREDDAWPWVEIVLSAAGASGAAVRALVQAGVDGIVAAGTGNGTLHRDLEEALLEARGTGVAVMRCSRCASGGVGLDLGSEDASVGRSAGDLSAVQARVELMLESMLAVKANRGSRWSS